MQPLIVMLEAKFYKHKGRYYGIGGHHTEFWNDYKKTFTPIFVAARVIHTKKLPEGVKAADGPNINFIDFPGVIGPLQFFRSLIKIAQLSNKISTHDYAYMLRIPSTLSLLLYFYLRIKKIPYGLELIGDIDEAYKRIPGMVTMLTRPILYRIVKNQCKNAVVVAYCAPIHEKKYPTRDIAGKYYYTGIRLRKNSILKPRKLSIGKESYTIIYVASMFSYKGHVDLINSMKLIHEFQGNIILHLVGDGQEQDSLRKLASDLNLDKYINFLGRLPNGEPVFKELDKSDLFISPSLTEGCPKSAIEAMARGLPVLLSNINGHKDFIHSDNYFDINNCEQIASKTITILNNQNYYDALSKHSILKARQYEESILSHARYCCYDELKTRTFRNI